MTDKDIAEIVEKYNAHQKLFEVTKLYRILEKIKCKTILEIGTCSGGSFRLWSTLLDENGLLIGIDPRGTVSWEVSRSPDYSHRINVIRNVCVNKGIKCRVKMIQGKSQDIAVVDLISKVLKKEKRDLDFLFIDGDHSKVEGDYLYYSPLIREDGIIAFHDISGWGPVKKLWGELLIKKYEIVDPEASESETGYIIKQRVKAIFLDRDGVINEIKVRNNSLFSPNSFEDFKLEQNVKTPLEVFKKLGFLNIIVTNQPGIARGYLKREELEKMHKFIQEQLPIDEIFFCPHDDSDNCSCRKPEPGLILSAKKLKDIDLGRSFCIGDAQRDIDAGREAGCKTVLLERSYNRDCKADYKVKNLNEVVELLKREV